MLVVKPFPAAELYQFIDRKLEGTKGKRIQQRLEYNIKGFHDAFTNTERWRKTGNWPSVLGQLEDLHRSVDRYYARLFQQLARQTSVHQAVEPMRTASEAIACKTIEKHPTSLTCPKDMRALNSRLLASDNYVPIDVNSFMEGLQPHARYRFMDKVKLGLSAPFQLWSWKEGGSSYISTHFMWKIPPKHNHTLRQEGESKAAAIIGELAANQEKHYGRVVMTAYLGSVVHPDFIGTKAAAKAVWQFITGDTIQLGRKECATAALWALNCCDQDVIFDMRAMNGATKDPAFDPFWKELEHQLHTYKTVHSRRYGERGIIVVVLVLFFSSKVTHLLFCVCFITGSDRSFLPFAVSIRSMIDKVIKALEARHAPATLDSVGIKIPSQGYVGMQFAPKNKNTTKALAYTGIIIFNFIIIINNNNNNYYNNNNDIVGRYCWYHCCRFFCSWRKYSLSLLLVMLTYVYLYFGLS